MNPATEISAQSVNLALNNIGHQLKASSFLVTALKLAVSGVARTGGGQRRGGMRPLSSVCRPKSPRADRTCVERRRAGVPSRFPDHWAKNTAVLLLYMRPSGQEALRNQQEQYFIHAGDESEYRGFKTSTVLPLRTATG